jgi:ubiquinone/menaquinone biosynthesis C-methylase UbiE
VDGKSIAARDSSAAEVWDDLAATYETSREADPVYRACTRIVVRAVRRPSQGAVVLDAGCGTGFATRALLAAGFRVQAVDFSARSLRMLEGRLGARADLATLQGDIRELPFPDAHFDALVCANTLQHLTPGESQERAAAELLRVLKPGCPYAVSVHHFSAEKERAGWVKEGKPGEPGVDYIFRFSLTELTALFPQPHRIRAAGFYDLPRFGPLALGLQLAMTQLRGTRLAQRQRGHMLVLSGRKPHES